MTVETRSLTDELHNFLRSRRSIRRFTSDPVPASVIERILETAIHAPSAHNLQPWRFAIITNLTAKTKLGLALTTKMQVDMTANGAHEAEIEARVKNSRRRLDEAPVVILLCRDTTVIRRDEQEEVTMAIQSVAGCGLQLLLAAHAEGLGGNWICWPLYAQEPAREALDLPVTWELQGMFILGFSKEAPKEKSLKELKSISLWI